MYFVNSTCYVEFLFYWTYFEVSKLNIKTACFIISLYRNCPVPMNVTLSEVSNLDNSMS